MSAIEALGRDAFRLARRAGASLSTCRHRARRRRLLVSVAVRSAWLRSRVDCHVAIDVTLGRRVRIEIEPHTTSAVHIGPLCRVGDEVEIHLRGGELHLGRAVDVRRGCVLEVAGRLELMGPNLIQRYSSLHCDDTVTIGAYAVLSEQVTVVDSTHPKGGPSHWFLDDLRTSPVTIGPHAWVGAKATVARGVHVGQRAVVSANSLVVRDVAPGWLVSGVPASPVRAALAADALQGDMLPADAAVGSGRILNVRPASGGRER